MLTSVKAFYFLDNPSFATTPGMISNANQPAEGIMEETCKKPPMRGSYVAHIESVHFAVVARSSQRHVRIAIGR